MIYSRERNDEITIYPGVLAPGLKTKSYIFNNFSSPEEMKFFRKEFSALYIKKMCDGNFNKLVANLLARGMFSELFSKKELKLAEEGIMPPHFNVHHQWLVSWGLPQKSGWKTLNHIQNLCVLNTHFHDGLHDFIYTPMALEIRKYLKLIQGKETSINKIRVVIPQFPKVVKDEHQFPIFVKQEQEQFMWHVAQLRERAMSREEADKLSMDIESNTEGQDAVIAKKKISRSVCSHRPSCRAAQQHYQKTR